MIDLRTAESYKDDNGNVIEYEGRAVDKVRIIFRGKNNRLEIHPDARFYELHVYFDCDNATVSIGRVNNAAWRIRTGQDATVQVGNRVTTTGPCAVSAVEGATVSIGNDVMIASRVRIRSDDAHPIFDVRTGKRVNPAKSITIGPHVWLGWGVMVLAGVRIRSGSVIGAQSVVTKSIPNNCIAVGVPAKVIRRDIAWERPHLSLASPPYKPDISTIRKTERFWKLTRDRDEKASPAKRRVMASVRRRLSRGKAQI